MRSLRYFATYELCKRFLAEGRGVSSLHATLPERCGAAVVAGCASWIVIYPADVVRSRILAFEARNPRGATPGVAEMAREVYGLYGVPGFFRGIGLTVLRAGPVAAAVLPLFDLSFAYLEVTERYDTN